MEMLWRSTRTAGFTRSSPWLLYPLLLLPLLLCRSLLMRRDHAQGGHHGLLVGGHVLHLAMRTGCGDEVLVDGLAGRLGEEGHTCGVHGCHWIGKKLRAMRDYIYIYWLYKYGCPCRWEGKVDVQKYMNSSVCCTLEPITLSPIDPLTLPSPLS